MSSENQRPRVPESQEARTTKQSPTVGERFARFWQDVWTVWILPLSLIAFWVALGWVGWIIVGWFGNWLFDDPDLVTATAVAGVVALLAAFRIIGHLQITASERARARQALIELPDRFDKIERKLNSLEQLVREVPEAIDRYEERKEKNGAIIDDMMALDSAIQNCLPEIEAALARGEKLADIAEKLPIDEMDWEYASDYRSPGPLTKSARLRMALPEDLKTRYLKRNGVF